MFVTPKVFMVGYTTINSGGLRAYLKHVGATAFLDDIEAAMAEGVSEGEALCSFYAKLCYAAHTEDRNLNITRVRSISDNVAACIQQGHGSVFEHCNLNFVATDVSRVLTHELVRHRVGTAFSQTSGRYVRSDSLCMVTDPILSEAGVFTALEQEDMRRTMEGWMRTANKRMERLTDFTEKKMVTSAVRRFLPNGQSNEIGFTINLRALRHMVQMRTSRHAEREIREVFTQVYALVRDRHPLIFADAKVSEHRGILEVAGMRMQPYEA